MFFTPHIYQKKCAINYIITRIWFRLWLLSLVHIAIFTILCYFHLSPLAMRANSLKVELENVGCMNDRENNDIICEKLMTHDMIKFFINWVGLRANDFNFDGHWVKINFQRFSTFRFPLKSIRWWNQRVKKKIRTRWKSKRSTLY